ncbi:hypothetical protein CAPTEDRAFT_170374 [Capitella teleta]|uniref:EF-hand domain-containing protein n=1 Tax=Capitella teleta TaxID=283909 RepID=R7URZ4_CAPTE|nr:hypothetical protein CAPTEDRAFT_170374 [Capitella teleta]|eukprot:ELU09289.1 hypothetical protein CAPTEDRAFT_170374 [Capitella teleta]
MELDFNNKQGGKLYGQVMAKQEAFLDNINKEYLENDDFKEIEELEEKLSSFKDKFMDFDLNNDGDIDFEGMKRMMEKLGQAKTHLELKKMISEVDKSNTGVICYRDFVDMMLGAKTSVLKLILLFEEKMRQANETSRPKGQPPKRSLADLP